MYVKVVSREEVVSGGSGRGRGGGEKAGIGCGLDSAQGGWLLRNTDTIL